MEVAVDNMWFGYEAEGTQVTQADSCQYDVAQLPTGRFHYWGVPKPEQKTQAEAITVHAETQTYKLEHMQMLTPSVHTSSDTDERLVT